jgi:hypothetical protein
MNVSQFGVPANRSTLAVPTDTSRGGVTLLADHHKLTVTQQKVGIRNGEEIWSQPDSAVIIPPVCEPAVAHCAVP